MRAIKISKCKISNIIERKRNETSILTSIKKYPKKMRTVPNFFKVKMLIRRKNLPTQKSFAKTLNTSVVTINKDIQLKKAKKKQNVHQLLLRRMSQRKTFC